MPKILIHSEVLEVPSRDSLRAFVETGNAKNPGICLGDSLNVHYRPPSTTLSTLGMVLALDGRSHHRLASRTIAWIRKTQSAIGIRA